MINSSLFQPGQLVRHPEEISWGVGQIQSVIGARVTVNFEHAGKRVINVTEIPLLPARHEGKP